MIGETNTMTSVGTDMPTSTVARVSGPAGSYFVKRVDRAKTLTNDECNKTVRFLAAGANDADEFRQFIDMLDLGDTLNRIRNDRQGN